MNKLFEELLELTGWTDDCGPAPGIWLDKPAGSRCLWSCRWTVGGHAIGAEMILPVAELSRLEAWHELDDYTQLDNNNNHPPSWASQAAKFRDELAAAGRIDGSLLTAADTGCPLVGFLKNTRSIVGEFWAPWGKAWGRGAYSNIERKAGFLPRPGW
jgi:hypothetical protein